MDKLIHAISIAPNEEARREILIQHAREFPDLLEPPTYPKYMCDEDNKEISRDFMLLTASISCLGRQGSVLLRYVYTGEFGVEKGNEARGFTMIGTVGHLDLAVSEWDGAPPYWEFSSIGFLPMSSHEILDEQLIDFERKKMKAKHSF